MKACLKNICGFIDVFSNNLEIDRFETRANEIDVIKVNDEEFSLYSARATWAEAVVQCRQKGLQIAEVKSKKVAQAVAMSMLRARPGITHFYLD